MVQAGAAQAMAVVELAVLPTGVVVGVGVEPTTAAELDGESNASANEVGW
jgi:hypothetical protein